MDSSFTFSDQISKHYISNDLPLVLKVKYGKFHQNLNRTVDLYELQTELQTN